MPYAATPVDVWGLGVVLHTLACHAVPFDGPTIVAIQEASRCSPEGLRFPARVSGGPCASCSRSSSSVLKFRFLCALADCRDLIRRMLQADPAARASLEEVLAHRWMNSAPGHRSLRGCAFEATKTAYAALRWPEKVDRDSLFRATDDARRKKGLANTLELVAQLCEGLGPPDPRSTPVVTGFRSRALLYWTSLLRALKGGRQAKYRKYQSPTPYSRRRMVRTLRSDGTEGPPLGALSQ